MQSQPPDRLETLEMKASVNLRPEATYEELQEVVDPAMERRIKWKLDLRILPLISSVYFFASMGRSDLGNAMIAGLTEELDLSPADYSNAATMFLLGYIVFQLPGTLLIKKIRAPIQFSAAMMLWGLLTALTVLIHDKASLFALRFLIGMAEAFVQGGIFYLSFWYQYSELATRGAIFYSMSTLAGAFNGMIAYGITKNLDGVNGWRAWRWIFLLEGVIPCGFAFVVLAFLPSTPSRLRLGFSAAEKEHVIRRSMRAHNTTDARLDVKKIHKVLLSLHFWLFVIIACAGHFCLSSLSNFLPDLIEGFGFATVDAQLFTVIVYASGCLGILFWARVADRTNARGHALAASAVLGVAGYAVLLAATERNARFTATCLVAFSLYPSVVLQLSWAATCFVGYTQRGSAVAFFNVFSQLFSICGTQAYQDPPYYRTGNASALGLSVVIVVFSMLLRWYLSYLNAKKRAEQLLETASQLRPKSIEEIGDKHPDFFYTI